MMPRHAAALVLIGWDLMVPPFRTCSECSRYFQPDPLNAPFDKWAIVDTFDTVAGCKVQEKLSRVSAKGIGAEREGLAQPPLRRYLWPLHCDRRSAPEG